MDAASVKGIFFKYIFMPLIAGILLIILGFLRKKMPAIKFKVIIIYILLASLCLAIPGVFGFAGNLFSPNWYIITMFIVLGLGIIHVNMSQKYFAKHIKSAGMVILFEIIISLTSLVFGSYLFVLIFKLMDKGTGYPMMAATSLSTFIVPQVFYYCYLQFISIPFDIYKTWQFNENQQLPNFDGIDFDRLMVLNIELTKNLEEGNRFLVKAKTLPSGVNFGDWFYRVVDDYNHKNPNSIIHLKDAGNEPYYWIFYVKKSFFSMRKYIDFEKDIEANNISENDVIICKRVIHHEEEGKSKVA